MNVKYMELSNQWEHNSLILTLTYQGSITSYLLKIASIAVHVISAFVTSNSIICTIAKLSLSFDGVLFQSSVCTIDSFYVCSKTFSCCFWLSLRMARRVTKEICLGLMHVEFFVIVLTCFVIVKNIWLAFLLRNSRIPVDVCKRWCCADFVLWCSAYASLPDWNIPNTSTSHIFWCVNN